jgi:predicted DNA-binding transcriptional regulator AlpA
MNGEPARRPTPAFRRVEPDRLLSIQEVSAMLQLPIQSIYKARSMGTFCPAYKIGRYLRWKRSDLLAWVESRKDPI